MNRPEFTEEQKKFIGKMIYEWYTVYVFKAHAGQPIVMGGLLKDLYERILPGELDRIRNSYTPEQLAAIKGAAEDFANGKQ